MDASVETISHSVRLSCFCGTAVTKRPELIWYYIEDQRVWKKCSRSVTSLSVALYHQTASSVEEIP
jgi:hypothetical protein